MGYNDDNRNDGGVVLIIFVIVLAFLVIWLKPGFFAQVPSKQSAVSHFTDR